jgi:hypothetical protein
MTQRASLAAELAVLDGPLRGYTRFANFSPRNALLHNAQQMEAFLQTTVHVLGGGSGIVMITFLPVRGSRIVRVIGHTQARFIKFN